jgi:sigma-B regulation protein RsbU (phosphoserine phosphatase)
MKHALLGTVPGRAIVVGAAVKIIVALLGLAVTVPSLVGLFDSLASIALAAGGAYFLFRGLALAMRRLLWRVRRKLIISYVFIGFVPAILIVAFFLLGGLLLFSSFSSYLVQSQLRSLTDRAVSLAQIVSLDVGRPGAPPPARVLERRQAAAEGDFPGVSMAFVATDARCASVAAVGSAVGGRPVGAGDATATAGPWAHVDPPTRVPPWVECSGFGGLLGYTEAVAPPRSVASAPAALSSDVRAGREVGLLARGVAFAADGHAVVVDLPVNGAAEALRRETGVQLAGVTTGPFDVTLLPARPGSLAGAVRAASPAQPFSSFSFPEVVDWETGRPQPGTLVAMVRLGIGEMYGRMSAAQGVVGGVSFGQGLLLVLVLIGVLFLIIEVLALIAGLALARSITGSVHELFVGTERVRQGDFTHKIAIAARDQLGELARSFNSMTASIEDLLLQAAEKKRLEEELRIAHDIQMSLLPEGTLDMPGVSVSALCVPAREVGGDYYDLLPLDDHRLGVLVADVSGKGTSAALYMAELKGLMLSLSRIHRSPRELLVAANRIIADHLDERSFITMTYAVVDLGAGTLTYARAGHTPLIRVPGPESDVHGLQILAPDGLVLGLKIDRGETFNRLLEERTLPLRAGDLYLFFTDGITEAMNPADDCFGEMRLGRLVEANAHLPSDDLRERVLQEIAAFVGDAPQHDDMTLIVLRIDSLQPSWAPARLAAGAHAATLGPP